MTSLPAVSHLHLSPATSVPPVTSVSPVFPVFSYTCVHWFSGSPSGSSILHVPYIPLYPLLFAIPHLFLVSFGFPLFPMLPPPAVSMPRQWHCVWLLQTLGCSWMRSCVGWHGARRWQWMQCNTGLC